MKTILLAGGSGFLGQFLERYFINKAYKVYNLTRYPKKENQIRWDGESLGEWTNILEKIDIIINLSGKSVDCRYNDTNKKLIYGSRINSTNVIGHAINHCKNPPKLWMNASTATIYQHSVDKKMTEEAGIIGNDFSMNIAKSWEREFFKVKNPKTRKIALRTSIVLGKKGGAFQPLKRLTKIGLGGKLGNGNQKVSWIHELDFARAIEFLIKKESLEGVFNITVPNPIDNKTFMKSLRKSIGIKIGINQPQFLLKIGALIIGTETELILKSRNVVPERLLNNGFKFKFTHIEHALKNLV